MASKLRYSSPSRWVRKNQQGLARLLLSLVFVVLVVLPLPKTVRFAYTFEQGSPWVYNDLLAPFDFPILKPVEEMEAERQQLLADFAPHYLLDTSMTVSSTELLLLLRESTPTAWASLPATLAGDTNAIISIARRALKTVQAKGLVSQATLDSLRNSEPYIDLRVGRLEGQIKTSELRGPQEASQILVDELRKTGLDPLGPTLVSALRPNITLDVATTDNLRSELISGLLPTRGRVQRGQLIIARGSLVTENDVLELRSLRSAYEEASVAQQGLWSSLGEGTIVGLWCLLLIYFLRYFRTTIYRNNWALAVLYLNVVAMVWFAAIVDRYEAFPLYVIPFSAFAIINRALFDVRVAVFANLLSCTLLGFISPDGVPFVVVQMLAGFAAIYSLVNIRRREQFFLTSFLVFLVLCIGYVAYVLHGTGTPAEIQPQVFLWCFIAALLTLLAYPLIYVYERIFGFVSDVTLMELSDMNSALLRELSNKAPGTFQHSVQVANLAEAAVRKVGGNTLLMRVGALYHDIGKMKNPLYFIENQSNTFNPHDEIDDEDSATIIIGHVRDGIALAKEGRLPETIIDFIRTHHGTQRVEYFYQNSLRTSPDENVNEALFRYPGPSPFSKETAILMMADSVEASSRSLKNITTDSLDSLVENIIDAQTKNGQFNNAGITLKDITLIKSTFKKMLSGIYHIRVAYPE